jgi:hypothetical protein
MAPCYLTVVDYYNQDMDIDELIDLGFTSFMCVFTC